MQNFPSPQALAVALLLFILAPPANAAPPNIIFVLADDLGWSELGCYGNRFNETPNLDRLASDGVRFTQAYAAAPVCSPYRAALLTGKWPARVGITDYLRPNSANALSTLHTSLPNLLQRRGYATGMIGKWHLTGYAYHDAEHEIGPRDHGFQWDFAREVKSVGNGANFWPYVFRKQPVRWVDIPDEEPADDAYLVDRMNRAAVEFIERNRDRPFFLYLSHYATHSILHGKPDLAAKYRKKHPPGKSTRDKCYLCEDQGFQGDQLNHWAGDHNPHLAAMLESIDDGIGAIQNKLNALGIADNTIIVFTSDNGGETNVTSNAPLRGGKSQLYEGGVRVPLIVSWPAQAPRRAVCEQPTMNVDFLPTFAEAAGIDLNPESVDGVSTLDTWKRPERQAGRRQLLWHYPLDRPHFLGGRSGGAIRDGDWKLIEFFDTGQRELYDLRRDPGEKNNIAPQHPDAAKRLSRQLASWRERIGAKSPSPPLLVEPRNLHFADHFEPKQVSSRWWFNKDWRVADGRLQRLPGNSTTRLFLQDPDYKNTLVRFDFQFGGAKDIRLVTGSGGNYNAVIHIRPDHFYIQTAVDRSVPYFPYRHGECAYKFEEGRWYSMTVEFLDDELVAHLDRKHLAYAKHPILNRTRKYFAFQVDQGAAAFDNVQIFHGAKSRSYEAGTQTIQAAANKFPVKKPLAEQRAIAKANAHSRLFRTDPQYAAIVEKLAEIDAEGKRLFPEAMKTHKEHRKEIGKRRKSLNDSDARYQALRRAANQAKQAVDKFLLSKDGSEEDLKGGARNRALDELRRKWEGDPEYARLVSARRDAEAAIEKAFPELFVTDEQITERKREIRKRFEERKEFRAFTAARAAAWRVQQEYLERSLLDRK